MAAADNKKRDLMTTTLVELQDWVNEVASLTQPARIHWCDGSTSENQRLVDEMRQSGDLLALDENSYPDCFLHRSDPSDVARVEQLEDLKHA